MIKSLALEAPFKVTTNYVRTYVCSTKISCTEQSIQHEISIIEKGLGSKVKTVKIYVRIHVHTYVCTIIWIICQAH